VVTPCNVDAGPVGCDRAKVTSSSLPTSAFVERRLGLSSLRSLRSLGMILGVKSLSGVKLPGSDWSGNSGRSRL
jgi:hypothetical protein